jgi:hypothetical protein
MPSLGDVYADPEFQQLSYPDQQQVLQKMWETDWSKTPDVSSLSPEDKQAVWSNIVYGPPAYEGVGQVSLTPEDEQAFDSGTAPSDSLSGYKEVLYIQKKLADGDPKAQDLYKSFVLRTQAANASLIGQVAMWGADTLRQVYDEHAAPELARHTRNLTKATAFLSAYAKPSSVQQAEQTAGIVKFGINTAEMVGLGALLGGTPEAASLAAAGDTAAASQASGVLTRGIYLKLGEMAAETASPAARTLLVKAAPFATDILANSAVGTLTELPRLLSQNKLDDPEFWGNVGDVFGQNVAADLVWGAARGLIKAVFYPFFQTFRKVDLSDGQSVKNLLTNLDDATDPGKFDQLLTQMLTGGFPQELLDQMENGDIIKERLQRLATLRNMPNIDITQPSGVKMLAAIADLDFEESAGKFILKDGDQVLFQGPKLSQAVGYLQSFLKETDPQQAISDDLRRMLIGADFPRTQISQVSSLNLGAKPTYKDKIGAPVIGKFFDPDMEGNLDTARIADGVRLTLNLSGLPKIDQDSVLKRITAVDTVDDVKTLLQSGAGANSVLLVPKVLNSEADRREFLSTLADQIKSDSPGLSKQFFTNMPEEAITNVKTKQAQLLDDLVNKYTPPLKLDPANLQVAVEKLGGQLTSNAGKFEITLADGSSTIFNNIREANQFLGHVTSQMGNLDFDSYKDLLWRTVRIHLEQVEDPVTKVTQYVARDAHGNIVNAANSLQGLMQSDPIFLPKLPEQFAPQLFLTSVKSKDFDTFGLEFTSDYAWARPQRLGEMLNNYASTGEFFGGRQNKLLLNIGDNGEEFYESARQRIEVFLPDLGVRKTFRSYKDAQTFAQNANKDYFTLEKLLVDKGFYIDYTNGRTTIRSPEGTTTPVKTLDDIKNILKTAPDPEWMPNVAKAFDQTFEDDLIQKAKDAIGNEDYTAKLKAEPPNMSRIGRSLRPALEEIHRIASSTGELDMGAVANKVVVAQRAYNSQLLNAMSFVNAIMADDEGHAISRDRLKAYQALIAIDPGLRPNVMKTQFNMDWTPQDTKVLSRTERLLDAYGRRFNVDAKGFITNYAPRVKAHLTEIANDPEVMRAFLAKSKEQQLLEIFGNDQAAIRSVRFMSEHSRIENFLAPGFTDDLYQSVRSYIASGLRNESLGPAIDQAKSYLKTIQKNDKISPADFSYFAGFLKTITHMETSPMEMALQEGSLKFTKALADNIRKLKGLAGDNTSFADFLDDLADSTTTTRGLEKLQNLTTFASLGFRPIRGLTNLMQYNNTRAIFDEYADLAITMTNMARRGEITGLTQFQKTVARLRQKGLISEMMTTRGVDTPERMQAFLDFAMRNQQNSELLTRAWTAIAAEQAFNDGYKKLAGNIVDWDGFIKTSRMSFLPPDQIAAIQKFIKEGRPDLARDLYSEEAVRKLMGDYNLMNRPAAFHGVVGSLFGKFGVYPTNQIDLYQSIATRGTKMERFVRMMKLIAYSQATYEAARMVGLDYNGFQFMDPFAFAGGPLYTTMNDMLQAKGSGYQAAIAQTRLTHDWKLFIPFSFEADSVLKAVQATSNNEYEKALYDVLGGNYTPYNIFNPGPP